MWVILLGFQNETGNPFKGKRAFFTEQAEKSRVNFKTVMPDIFQKSIVTECLHIYYSWYLGLRSRLAGCCFFFSFHYHFRETWEWKTECCWSHTVWNCSEAEVTDSSWEDQWNPQTSSKEHQVDCWLWVACFTMECSFVDSIDTIVPSCNSWT